jgi:hypothetical protein
MKALDLSLWFLPSLEEPKDSLCHLKSTLSHHDHHNVEIKNYFEVSQKKFRSDMEVALFIPKSLQATSWRKQDIYGDFRPRLRLSIPMQNRMGHSAQTLALENLKVLLARMAQLPLEEPFSEQNDFQEIVKELGAIFSENLKYSGSRVKKHLLMSSSLMAPEDLGSGQVLDLLSEMDFYSSHLKIIRSMAQLHPAQTLLGILDEFLTQSFIQYLGQMQAAAAQGLSQGKSEQFLRVQAELVERMKSIQRDEVENALKKTSAEHRGGSEHSRNPQSEGYLHHMGQLKKFFQSRMFLEVTRKPSAQKISETMALLGATCAGVWAMLIQRLNRPELFDMAFQGLFLFCFGVIAFVMRDWIKDWVRDRLSRTASDLIPDFHQSLSADQEGSVGFVKEWFHVQALKKNSGDYSRWRAAYTPKEILSTTQEDLIVYKKSQEILSLASNLSTRSGPKASGVWAVQENIRVNLERFLRHMDDPHKDISILQTDGTLAAYRSHKVYHFYFLVQLKLNPKKKSLFSKSKSSEEALHENSKLYRVVMDKLGIQRVEEITHK